MGSVCCFFAMALFSSYLVGLASITEILLFFLGLIGIGVEIFVLPGVLVFGGLGLLSLAISLVLSQQDFIWPQNELQQSILTTNLLNLLLLLGLVLVGTVMLWRLLPKVPLFNRVLLPPPRKRNPWHVHPASRMSGAPSSMGMVGRTGAAGDGPATHRNRRVRRRAIRRREYPAISSSAVSWSGS